MARYNLNHDAMKGQVCSQVYVIQGKPWKKNRRKANLPALGWESGVMSSDLQGCFLPRVLFHGSYKGSGYPLEVQY